MKNSRKNTFTWQTIGFALFILFSLALFNEVSAREGLLDTTFGDGGKVTTAIQTFDIASSVLAQPDGKIIVGGTTRVLDNSSTYRSCLVRYRPDGTIDPLFGVAGKVITSSYQFNLKLALQTDGKIISVGNISNNVTGTDFILTRYQSDGSLDNSFGVNGVVTTDISGSNRVSAISIQPDGKLVVSGYIFSSFSPSIVVLVRYNQNGTLDTSFGQNGIIAENFGILRNALDNLIQPDGKILVLTGAHPLRFNANGTLDLSYGTNGFPAPFGLDARDFGILPDGKIIIAGNNGREFFLQKANQNGTPDLSFPSTLQRFTGFFDDVSSINSLAIQNNGKIVVAGSVSYTENSIRKKDFALARFNADGSLDLSFDDDGKVLTDFGALEQVNGIAIQPNGNIVAAGESVFNLQSKFAISRYLASVAVPFDFDDDRKADVSVYRPSNGTWYRLNSSNNTVSAIQFGIAEDKPVPADYDGDRKADIAVFRPSTGTWYILNSTNSEVTIKNFGVNADIPMPGDYDGDGKADITVYRPSTGTWYLERTSNQAVTIQRFGIAEDRPVTCDYDADGKDDIAVWRPSTSVWYFLSSRDSSFAFQQFGISSDRAVPADYESDGRCDFAIWRSSGGGWFGLRQVNGSGYYAVLGMNGDIPVPTDYDGDGKTDLAVFRPSTRTWWILRSSNSTVTTVFFGLSDDIPLPSVYTRQ